MSRSMMVSGEVTAEDTPVTLTAQGSVTAADRRVPAGANHIDRIVVSVAASFAAADNAVAYIRLSNAVKGGDQILAVSAAAGQAVQAGADPTAHGLAVLLDDLEIGVVQGKDLIVKAEMSAGDVGAMVLGVNVFFGA